MATTPVSISRPATAPVRQTAAHPYPVPKPGVYVPAITFFDSKDRICPAEQKRYYEYLSKTGLNGLVILGTNAETFLLTRDERKQLLQLARSTVGPGYPIIAGVGGHSTAQVLEYINDAYEAGADYALVLPCAYFGKQTTPEVVKVFFSQVADESPIPVIVYNFPAVCNGLDLDSEIITEIAQHPKVVGVKLTCGSVAKIARLAATFDVERFAVFGGQSDFLVGGLAVGSAGCIAAFGNIFPHLVVKIYNLYARGDVEEAKRLQKIAALAESPTKAGIANTKYAAAEFTASKAGIKNAVELLKPRRPYFEPNEAAKKKIRETMVLANEIEVSLANVRQSRL
ncbi:hypothetical protein LTR64_002153 [Lithohypha guttulata]|uniref:4-hydroxy-2-oxoglutarate aldolase, mitochondrial n=1 Tax=Lithohypha guttulata TaxID=1690604 RepID=A0AAN7STM3_9EURO|nr:hypothetical protein LTR51_001619 [Lithohypha guttulata]KAK5081035.1 hypothetical protein LTR05_008352 [Lithohypha guttulata]